MKRFLLTFALAFALIAPSLSTSAATTIELTASPTKGIYSGPVYVKLAASDPNAKIWYTCKRNGTPGDALPYSKPILLDRSCALIAFAYTDYEHESKIIRNDYTIRYSEDVKLDNTNGKLSLINTGKETVNVWGWELYSESGSIEIPAGTTITPLGEYSVTRAIEGVSYILKSPDAYEKFKLAIPKKIETELLAKQQSEKQTVSRSAPKTLEPVTLTGTVSETGSALSGIITEPTMPAEEVSAPVLSKSDSPAKLASSNETMKASSVESSKLPFSLPIAIAVLVALLVGTKFTLVVLKR